ncbi:MAG: hypothetical protein AAGD32_02980 [Planctomycetota bacterium]
MIESLEQRRFLSATALIAPALTHVLTMQPPGVGAAHEGMEQERLAEIEEWALEQFGKIKDLLTGIGDGSDQANNEAGWLSRAIVDAVKGERVGGDQLPGNMGNYTGGNQCGDWQAIIGNAIVEVLPPFNESKFKVYMVQAFDADGDEHNWIEIDGQNGTVVVDPWPNGGTGEINDTSVWNQFTFNKSRTRILTDPQSSDSGENLPPIIE